MNLADVLRELELGLAQKRALFPSQRVDGYVTHLLLVGWARILILLRAEEYRELVEDDGEIEVDLALRDLAKGR